MQARLTVKPHGIMGKSPLNPSVSCCVYPIILHLCGVGWWAFYVLLLGMRWKYEVTNVHIICTTDWDEAINWLFRNTQKLIRLLSVVAFQGLRGQRVFISSRRVEVRWKGLRVYLNWPILRLKFRPLQPCFITFTQFQDRSSLCKATSPCFMLCLDQSTF